MEYFFRSFVLLLLCLYLCFVGALLCFCVFFCFYRSSVNKDLHISACRRTSRWTPISVSTGTTHDWTSPGRATTANWASTTTCSTASGGRTRSSPTPRRQQCTRRLRAMRCSASVRTDSSRWVCGIVLWPARRYASAALYGPVSVRVCHKPVVVYRNGWTNRAGF